MYFFVPDRNIDPVGDVSFSLDHQIAGKRRQSRRFYQLVEDRILLGDKVRVRHFLIQNILPEAEMGPQEHGFTAEIFQIQSAAPGKRMCRRQRKKEMLFFIFHAGNSGFFETIRQNDQMIRSVQKSMRQYLAVPYFGRNCQVRVKVGQGRCDFPQRSRRA